MPRRVFVTSKKWPASAATKQAAADAGADEILHGIPPALAGVIPEGHSGYFELPDEPPPAPDPFTVLVEALAQVDDPQVRAAAEAAGA